MTDERGHAAGSAGPRKSRRVGKGALLDCSRGDDGHAAMLFIEARFIALGRSPLYFGLVPP